MVGHALPAAGRALQLARLAAALPAFLRQPVSPAMARRQIAERLATRGERFLDLVDRTIFANPAGIYARLLARAGIGYVLTHTHVLFSSRVNPDIMRRLAPHLRLLVEFDPFVAGRKDAVFEARDAYYVPMASFGAVTRPGPVIRIYAFENRPRDLPPKYARLLRKNADAWADFKSRPPWYRRTTTWWVVSAKKEETRLRRLDALIESCARGVAIAPLKNVKK